MRINPTIWLNHFEYHAQHRHARLPDFGPVKALSDAERTRIAGSIAIFQLGEQSDGTFLLRAARRHAQKTHTPEIVRLMQLFVAEEQSHAALLGNFMDRHGIARKRSDWTDDVFRSVRRLAGFELHLTVLLTAELIGKVYYRALEAATANRELRALCRALVADELAHIGFESDLLIGMRERKSRISRQWIQHAHRAFLQSAAVIVWLTHRLVLAEAGYTLRTFLSACAAQYAFYLDAPPHSAAGARLRGGAGECAGGRP